MSLEAQRAFAARMNGEELSKAAIRRRNRRAAADELYAAVEALDKLWCEPSFSGGRPYSGPDDPNAIAYFTPRMIATWKAARAALAKARGEA